MRNAAVVEISRKVSFLAAAAAAAAVDTLAPTYRASNIISSYPDSKHI